MGPIVLPVISNGTVTASWEIADAGAKNTKQLKNSATLSRQGKQGVDDFI
jgi:hypothetical protein